MQVPVTVMTTQQKQVTDNVTQQYAVNVPVQVPVTVMTTQQKQVTDNVTQQYAVNVPVQVPVTVMTTQQKQVTDNVTQQYAVSVPVQVPVTVMTTQSRQVPRQVAVTKRVMVPVQVPAAAAPAAVPPRRRAEVASRFDDFSGSRQHRLLLTTGPLCPSNLLTATRCRLFSFRTGAAVKPTRRPQLECRERAPAFTALEAGDLPQVQSRPQVCDRQRRIGPVKARHSEASAGETFDGELD